MEELRPPGIGLGLVGMEPFEKLIEEVTIPLEVGDRLIFYTDGVTDAMDATGSLYGDQRLKDVLLSQREAPARALRDAVMRSVRDFASEGDLSDDLTLIALRVLKVGGTA